MSFRDIVNKFYDIKTKIAAEALFLTKSFNDFVVTLVSAITSRYGAQKIWVEIKKQGKDEVAHTNGNIIFANPESCLVMAARTNARKFRVFIGVILHECGHILYTDFDVLENAITGIRSLSLKNKAHEKVLRDLVAKNPKVEAHLEMQFMQLYNIVEDGFVNNALKIELPGYARYLKTALQVQYLESDSFERMKGEKNVSKYIRLLSMIHQYLIFGMFKHDAPLSFKDEEVMFISDLSDTLNACLEETDAANKELLIEDIFIKLLPYLCEDANKAKSQNKNNQKSRTGAGGSKPNGSGKAKVKPNLPKKVNSSGGASKGNENGQSRSDQSNGQSKSGQSGSQNSSKKTEDGGRKSEAGNQSKGSNFSKGSDSGKNSGNSNAGTHTASKKPEGEDSGKGSMADEGSNKDTKDENAGNSTNGQQTESGKQEAVNKLSEREKEKLEDMYNTSPDLTEEEDNAMNTANKEAEDKMYDDALCKALKQWDKTPGHHKGQENKTPDFERPEKSDYKSSEIVQGEKAGKILARELDKTLKERKMSRMTRGMYFGKRIDSHSVTRYDKKYFSKKETPGEIPNLAVGLVLDMSGSMSYERICVTKKTAAAITSACNKLEVPLAAYGFTSSYDPLIIPFADFYRVDDISRLDQIDSRSNSNMLYPYQMMMRRIIEVPATKRLIIVITDGRPNDTGLSDEEELAQFQAANRIGEHNSVVTYGASIGCDTDNLREIFGDHILVIDDLNELPKVILKIIKKNLI